MRSAMLPDGTCQISVTTRYDVTTLSVTLDGDAPKSALSAGSATATIVELSGLRIAPRVAEIRMACECGRFTLPSSRFWVRVQVRFAVRGSKVSDSGSGF